MYICIYVYMYIICVHLYVCVCVQEFLAGVSIEFRYAGCVDESA